MQVASDNVAQIMTESTHWNPGILSCKLDIIGNIYPDPEYEHTDPLGCQKIRDKIRFPKEKCISIGAEKAMDG